jgi:ABC-type transport system involved in cytochrome bd biosynthesis fused ATPase/permease subunit
MVSVVRSLVKSFAVLALAVAPVLAQDGAANAEDANAELVAEIAVRDSVMAVRDSACTVEKQSLRSELEVEKAKCENWEQSYNTLKKNNETCAKALSVAVEASQEQAEKDKNAKEEKEASDRAMTSVSMLGSFGIGMLIMWLIMK